MFLLVFYLIVEIILSRSKLNKSASANFADRRDRSEHPSPKQVKTDLNSAGTDSMSGERKYPGFSSWVDGLNWPENSKDLSAKVPTKMKRGTKEIQLDLFCEAQNG